MTTPRSKIWFYEFRPGCPRAAESADLHNQILDAWAAGATKAEIARMFQVDKHTVRRITWRARKAGDLRGIAQTKPVFSTWFACNKPLKLWREQYIVRGLARAFEMSHSKVYSELCKITKELEQEEVDLFDRVHSMQMTFSFLSNELKDKQEAADGG